MKGNLVINCNDESGCFRGEFNQIHIGIKEIGLEIDCDIPIINKVFKFDYLEDNYVKIGRIKVQYLKSGTWGGSWVCDELILEVEEILRVIKHIQKLEFMIYEVTADSEDLPENFDELIKYIKNKMPKKYVKSFTYEPKIKLVTSGKCKQTIRIGDKIKKGDSILFHGWEGQPYFSDWTWRIRVTVSEVIPIEIFNDGIKFKEPKEYFIGWDSETISGLARRDGISKLHESRGKSMGVLFNKMYPKLPSISDKIGATAQIIRWMDWKPEITGEALRKRKYKGG